MKSVRNFVSLGLVVIINLSLQFLFQWYIITSLGVNKKTDALFGAIALPQFILLVLSGSLTMVLIPQLARYENDKFLKESWNYFQAVGILFITIALLLYLTDQWWVILVLPGFKGINYYLTLDLVRIQLIAMVFSSLLSVLWAIHSAKGNFYKIEYTSIIANLIIFVVIIVLMKVIDVYVVAWINVLRVALQMFFLIKIMEPYCKPDFTSISFKNTWKNLKPLIAGNMLYKTDVLIDRHLTSNGIAGELTLFNLAQQLYAYANSIFIKVLVNTMVPEMAKANEERNERRFNKIYKQRLLLSFIFSGICYLIIIFFGQWVLDFVFNLKKITAVDVHQLWWLLVLLGGYLIFGLLGYVTSGAFYAKSNTITPTKIGVILFIFYAPLKVYSYVKFGIVGLAICGSVNCFINFIVKFYFLRKNLW